MTRAKPALKYIKPILCAWLIHLACVTQSLADWRQDLGVFRIGMIENEAIKLSPAELERIRAAYKDALGMPVEIIRSRDYPALIDAHASSRIEYAIYSATAYSTAYLVCECIEPLVQPIAADGSMGTRTVLLLDATVNPSQISVSKGIAIPGRGSLNGYGIPLSADKVLGIKLKGTEPWLKFARSNSSALNDYVSGNVDGLFATVGSEDTLVSALQTGSPLSGIVLSSGRLTKAVWLSNIVANGPHAVRRNLANEAKDKLLNFLIHLEQTDPDLNDLLLPENEVRFMSVAHGAYTTAINATKQLAANAEQSD